MGYLRHGLDFLLRGRGPVTTPIGHAVIFDRADPSRRDTEYEILFSPLGLNAGADENNEHDLSDIRPLTVSSVGCAIAVLHPRSRGSVEIRSADVRDRPVIRLELAGNNDDVALLTAVARHTRSIFEAESLRPFVTGEIRPGKDVSTDSEWTDYIRSASLIGQHPVGTCRMGNDSMSVVDSELRVRGLERLRVVDASVMPTLVAAHTNAAVMMIAERASDFIRADANRS